MTTREEALAEALELPGAYRDTPFHDDNWVVVRRGNRRIFLATFERQGRIWLNVKCAPGWSDVLCASFEQVVPAYHMNKVHWSFVLLPDTAEDLVAFLVNVSYEATREKKQKVNNDIGPL